MVLAPSIVAATISQRAAGVDFTPGEMIGPVSGFTLLGLVAIGLLVRSLHSIDETPHDMSGKPPVHKEDSHGRYAEPHAATTRASSQIDLHALRLERARTRHHLAVPFLLSSGLGCW